MHRMTRDEGGTGGRQEREGGRKGHYGLRLRGTGIVRVLEDKRRGRAARQGEEREGEWRGREGERALGEEGTTDIHHKAGCSGADGRGSSGSECRKLPECTAAAAAAAFSRCLSAVRALLPSSRRGFAVLFSVAFPRKSPLPGARVIRPVIPDVPELSERTSRPTLSIDVRIRHR